MRDKQQTNKRTNKRTLKIELLSQWKLEAEFRNSFKLRNETILKEVTDCGKAARDFIAG